MWRMPRELKEKKIQDQRNVDVDAILERAKRPFVYFFLSFNLSFFLFFPLSPIPSPPSPTTRSVSARARARDLAGNSDFKKRRIVSQFMKDKTLGDKRMVSVATPSRPLILYLVKGSTAPLHYNSITMTHHRVYGTPPAPTRGRGMLPAIYADNIALYVDDGMFASHHFSPHLIT